MPATTRSAATWLRNVSDKAYRVTGLMPAHYLAAAVDRERLNLPPGGADTAFFEQLAKEATSFVIGEDEQRTVDLKIIAAAEGG